MFLRNVSELLLDDMALFTLEHFTPSGLVRDPEVAPELSTTP
jgi:hypothetical protein